MTIYQRYIKRLLDLLLSILGLIILSPIVLFVAILVRTKLGSPVIFKQKRPGLNEEIFELYKFRTMTDAKDKNGNELSDEERLTSFGRKLRTTSLDEIPELINIIKGDMGLVGPRPLLVRYLPYYTEEERKRHSVRPGLTGLAQINGRNNLGWDERLKLDVEYVESISFINDLRIVLKTVGKVFTRSDIASGEQLLMENLDIERDWMTSDGDKI